MSTPDETKTGVDDASVTRPLAKEKPEAAPINPNLSHRALVGDALDLLHRVLQPYIEREMEAVYGNRWVREARSELHGKAPDRWDTSDLLTLLYNKFFPVFRDIGHEGRSWVSLLREVRKKWAHQAALTPDETRRTLETAMQLLEAVGAYGEAARLEPHVLKLMQAELQHKMDADGSADEQDGEAEDPAPDLWGGFLNRGLKTVRRFVTKTPPTEPVEVRRALLDAIERAAEPHRRHFAFNRLVVHVLAREDRTRLLFEAALNGQAEPFGNAVLCRFDDARIPAPTSLSVSWKFYRRAPQRFAEHFQQQPYYIELQQRKVSTTATLSVIKGKAVQDRFTIRSGSTVTIGRQAEVSDERGRMVRRNVVAFLDYEDQRLDEETRQIHESISRVHARVCYHEADAAFRLYDDQSTWGTSVVRDGCLVPFQVRQQPVALQHGDLIYIGKACLRFTNGKR